MLTALFALVAAGSPLAAQVDISSWPEVRVEVLAVDPDGNAVSGLTADELLAQGVGKPRPVAQLVATDDPQSVCVLIDASDADRLALVRSKAQKLLRNLAPADEVCVAAFSTTLFFPQQFTADRRAAMNAVEAIRPVGGTQLRDAVLHLGAYMRANAQFHSRAIILFSDGTDERSEATDDQLRRGMETAGSPVVHMICLPKAFGNARRKQADPKQGTAFRITELGGGLTYFPHNMSDMNGLVDALPESMRWRYVLTLSAANPARDGHEERFEIVFDKAHRNQMASNVKIRVQAPEGFYAPVE